MVNWTGDFKNKIEKFKNFFSQSVLTKKLAESPQLLHSSIMQNFREGGRPERWQLSKRLLEPKKGKREGQSVPLILTGRLRGSVDKFVEYPKAGILVKKLKYAKIHQFGFEEKNIPKRPYLVMQKEDEEKIREIIFGVK